ncbi:initiator RepB protein [Caballeronia choica]|uniref:Initiator RepB protein n=1 Tax=Caballeronia choica TaxID=326476 RepID=A0A158GWZ0_9BURK|nr:replication initiation protein [Caballeronia choica]SAL36367.1 initiator RepB protein [Caballeronia choica]
MADEIVAKATPRQMSLGLFEDMFPDGLPINESPKEIGFQRNNVFVEITDMGVTARRLIDAAYFIVAQEKGNADHYDVELNYFKWLMRYDSKNHVHLRAVITEVQKSLIQVTDTPPDQAPQEKDLWVSVQLLGIVGIHNGRIRFEVPPQLLRHIKDTDKSHWLSLRITSAFTLSAARAIYDHILPFVPHGMTDWIPLDVIRNWAGKSGASAAVFKYFKRDTFEPAVRQINELSDIDLSYETRTESVSSKKIDRIRFRMSRKETADSVRASLQGAQELYLALKNEFGVTTKQFIIISENRAVWTDERIQQAIEYTRFRLDQGKITKSPAGYLMKALRDNWQVPEAERKMVAILEEKAEAERVEEHAKEHAIKKVEANHAARDAEVRSRTAEEVRQGRALFEAFDARARKDLVRSYLVSPAGKLLVKRLKLESASLTEVDLLSHADLAWAFSQFVFLRTKSKAKKTES